MSLRSPSLVRPAPSSEAEVVLAGDAASDMQMAWNAGIEPIAVLLPAASIESKQKSLVSSASSTT